MEPSHPLTFGPASMLVQLLPVLAPVFIAAGIGYAWTRWAGPFDSVFIARLVTNIFAPALIFSTLTSTKADPSRILIASVSIVACILLAGAVAFVVLRALKLPLRAYLPAAMFPNLGNIGGPVCYFAFGDEGLAYAVAVMAAASITMWTLGTWISAGTLSPRRVLTTPPVVAAAGGALFIVAGWSVPVWAHNTLQLIGSPTFPLMLLALGASLASMKVSNMKLSVALGAFRILLGTVVGIAVSEALGLKALCAA